MQAEDVERELWRVTSRLATLGPARLDRADDEGVALADRVRPVLQWLADTAAELEKEPRRAVPRLRAHGLGDQLVVLVRDVLTAAPETDVIRRAHDRLVDLRRTL